VKSHRPRNNFHAWANGGSFPDALALSSAEFTSLRSRSDSRVIANRSGARVSTYKEKKTRLEEMKERKETERKRERERGARGRAH